LTHWALDITLSKSVNPEKIQRLAISIEDEKRLVKKQVSSAREQLLACSSVSKRHEK
jgi:hypothetical protein